MIAPTMLHIGEECSPRFIAQVNLAYAACSAYFGYPRVLSRIHRDHI